MLSNKEPDIIFKVKAYLTAALLYVVVIIISRPEGLIKLYIEFVSIHH